MKRTKKEAEITKKQIIDDAMYLFLKKGFSATKIGEIADRSGVTRGAVYWHFQNKRDIVTDIIKDKETETMQLLDESFSSDRPTDQIIRNLFKKVIDNFFGNKDFRDFIELTWFKIEYTQLVDLSQSKDEMNTRFTEVLTKLISRAQAEGLIPGSMKAKVIALHLNALIQFIYRSYFIQGAEFMTKAKARNMVNSYFQTVLKIKL